MINTADPKKPIGTEHKFSKENTRPKRVLIFNSDQVWLKKTVNALEHLPGVTVEGRDFHQEIGEDSFASTPSLAVLCLVALDSTSYKMVRYFSSEIKTPFIILVKMGHDARYTCRIKSPCIVPYAGHLNPERLLGIISNCFSPPFEHHCLTFKEYLFLAFQNPSDFQISISSDRQIVCHDGKLWSANDPQGSGNEAFTRIVVRCEFQRSDWKWDFGKQKQPISIGCTIDKPALSLLDYACAEIDLFLSTQPDADEFSRSLNELRKTAILDHPLMLRLGKACASSNAVILRCNSNDKKGVILTHNGDLFFARSMNLTGDDALWDILSWLEVSIQERELPHLGKMEKNLNLTYKELIRNDKETEEGSDEHREKKLASDNPNRQKEIIMAIKDHLNQFNDVEGFQAAAVFTAQGQMLETISLKKMDMKTVGMYANNALLNAQKATDQMGVGRGNMVQIRSPKANILLSCYNEASDFAETKSGRAHIHCAVVMDPEGNIGMAGFLLDKLVEKIAEELR